MHPACALYYENLGWWQTHYSPPPPPPKSIATVRENPAFAKVVQVHRDDRGRAVTRLLDEDDDVTATTSGLDVKDDANVTTVVV